MNRKTLILSVLAVAVTVFAVAAWYVSRPATSDSSATTQVAAPLVRPWSPILGPAKAPVTIVEFFDPACETCRAMYPIVKDIMAEHGKAVRVVIRYTPFHGEVSEEAIRVLEAARVQGVYEPVLEALLREQPQWASHGGFRPDLILPIAQAAGLDTEAAKEQVRAPAVDAILQNDRADGRAYGIRATPTFFVNGLPLPRFGVMELRTLVAEQVAARGS